MTVMPSEEGPLGLRRVYQDVVVVSVMTFSMFGL